MKLNIHEIPEEGMTLELAVDEESVAELAGLGAGGVKYKLLEPIKGRLSINLAGSVVSVEGSFEAALSLDCSRCLKPFTHTAAPEFTLYYARGGGGRGGGGDEKETELSAEELEINYIEGDILDTKVLLLEQFTLNLATKPLCRAECKGLCPACGKDLNPGPCGCKKEERIDPRFAGLKDFKVK